jgi:hypothetical protein
VEFGACGGGVSCTAAGDWGGPEHEGIGEEKVHRGLGKEPAARDARIGQRRLGFDGSGLGRPFCLTAGRRASGRVGASGLPCWLQVDLLPAL